MGFQEHPLTSVSDLVNYTESCCSEQGTVLFRGQRTDEPLRPRIARVRPKRFDPSRPLLSAEQKMLRSFKRRSLPFLELTPRDDWDWLAVAQHFGLPTRLLDWSVNALAALWFAVDGVPARNDVGTWQRGVLWVFKPREGTLDQGGDFVNPTEPLETTPRGPGPFDVRQTAVFVPRSVSRRIVAQGGYFTVHPAQDAEPHFRAFEEENQDASRLVKFHIAPALFPTLRHDLSRLGIHSMSIFPDLGGLCRDIRWRYTFEDDEDPSLWGLDGQLVRNVPSGPPDEP